tara:strand:- start:5137 stop:5673 length:537 start_codon:yes stop_codon:yes gene_type:complete
MGKYTVKHGLLLLLALTLSPCVAASGPACIAYAYTVDGYEGHYSLISQESYVFGTEIYVISNCNNTQLIIDNELVTTGNNTLRGYTTSGTHQVTILNEGFNQTYQNVTFIQSGALTNVIRELPAESNPYSNPYTPSEISNIEIFAAVGALILSWLMVVGVMWKLISNYQDNNFISEVV